MRSEQNLTSCCFEVVLAALVMAAEEMVEVLSVPVRVEAAFPIRDKLNVLVDRETSLIWLLKAIFPP